MILHLANDYSGSTVYKNLIAELDNLSIPQIIYTPLKDSKKIGRNKISLSIDDSKLIYSLILNSTTDRVFYKKKINKLFKDIESKIDMSKITFIHAHTWYSDGGVAYLLAKKYRIPYIITIRNTDINIHYKYLVHYRAFGKKILYNAKNIILIGKYQTSFFRDKIKIDNIELNSKILIVPNGVDEHWISHSKPFIPKNTKPFKILFVGSFLKRKNLLALQRAIIEAVRKEKCQCELHIVGGANSHSPKLFNNIKAYPEIFTYHGQINNKSQLLKIYDECHVFAMPSIQETFGLVYVEAMLQGLPILYTANEGIDGFYNNSIGEKVNSKSVNEIKHKILNLYKSYNSYNIPTEEIKNNHNWKNIALIYQKLYN